MDLPSSPPEIISSTLSDWDLNPTATATATTLPPPLPSSQPPDTEETFDDTNLANAKAIVPGLLLGAVLAGLTFRVMFLLGKHCQRNPRWQRLRRRRRRARADHSIESGLALENVVPNNTLADVPERSRVEI
ncbi:hypothetical protein F5Y09DRAFT_341449 [Xylaria sp. FL1042]|nr:hypothetical protein F5Y09DRAFT_341449 [Xylaria sp. FL1042]